MRMSFVVRLGVLAVMAGSGCQCGSKSLQGLYGELVIEWLDETGQLRSDRDATFDFGFALVGGTSERRITLRNVGSGNLELSQITVLEGDEVAFAAPGQLSPVGGTSFQMEFDTLTLPPGSHQELLANFTPAVRKGQFYSRLELRSNGGQTEKSTAMLTFVAKSEQGACDFPSTLDFGSTPIGETLTASIPFQNPTGLSVSGHAGPISGTDAASFAYTADSPRDSILVPAASSVSVTFSFSPTEAKNYEAQVVLRGAGPCEDQVVTLKGRGSSEILSWSPTSLDFGYVNPGDAATREVIFINPASVPITLTQVKTSAAEFAQAMMAGQDATTFSVPGGGVPTPMKVTCTPSALGPRTGTLTFQTGLKQIPAGVISLACVGGGPRIRVTPRPTLSFGRVPYAGGTGMAERKVLVENVGTRPPTQVTEANLFLGKVQGATPGNQPFFEVRPGAGTAADEFQFRIPSSYNPAVGLPAVAGQNAVNVEVTFKPQSMGRKTATFVVHSNDPREPEISVEMVADAQDAGGCMLTISPLAQLDFGTLLDSTAKELPVRITNVSVTAGEICHLSNITLTPESHRAFSLVGAPVADRELQPQESFDLMVRTMPIGQPKFVTVQGTLQFDTSDVASAQVRIPLRARLSPSCLVISPSPLNFGNTKLGCTSSSRSFTVSNTCGNTLAVKKVTMVSGAGQPAGGSNCTGSVACPEFSLTSFPTIPASTGLPLKFGESLTGQLRYRPLDVGSDSGALAVEVTDAFGDTATYVLPLQGQGTTAGGQLDSYTQSLNPRADVLLVIDDSKSMLDKQIALASNFASFIQYAQSANVDYRIGVTTSSMRVSCDGSGSICEESVGFGGKLVRDVLTGLTYVTPTTPDVAAVFARLVKVGTKGASPEQPLATGTLALTGVNQDFVRPEANLAVVVVTDTADQSKESVSYYQTRLMSVKGSSGFTFSAISPRMATAPTSGSCLYDVGDFSSARFDVLINATNGVAEEICSSNWAQALERLGQTSFQYRPIRQFPLTQTPASSSSVIVRVNGVAVAPGSGSWSYQASSNSVQFSSTAVPAAGTSIEIEYAQACF